MAIREELTLGLQGWKKGIEEARGDVRRLNRDIRQDIRGGAGRGGTDGGGGIVGGMVGSAARTLGPAVVAMAAFRTGVDAVSIAMERQRAEMALGAVSTEDVGDQLERLAELGQDPGLGFDQVVAASTRLQAVGISAELAEKTIAEMGNALALVGGGKEQLDGVMLALTQIMAKGKVSAEEINQIAERLPQIRTLMQDAFGTADTEVLQKMGISGEELLVGITTSAEKLERAIVTSSEALSNLQDQWKQTLQDIGDLMEPAMTPIFNTLSSLLAKSTEVVRNVVDAHLIYGGAALGIDPGKEVRDRRDGGNFKDRAAKMEEENAARAAKKEEGPKPSEIAAKEKEAEFQAKQMENFDKAEAAVAREQQQRQRAAEQKRAAELERAANERARLAENVAGMAFATMDPEAQMKTLRARVQNSLGVSDSREEILKAANDAANEGWLEKAQVGFQTVEEMDAIAGRMSAPGEVTGGSAQGSLATLMDEIFGRGTPEQQLDEIKQMKRLSEDTSRTLNDILKKMDEEVPRDVWSG